MVCLGINGIFLLSSLGCLLEIAMPAVFSFRFSPASSKESQSVNTVDSAFFSVASEFQSELFTRADASKTE